MGCGSTQQTTKYQYRDLCGELTPREKNTLAKWGLGAAARRRVTKLLQQLPYKQLAAPAYDNGVLTSRDDCLFTDDDLAFILSANGAGNGLYWNTFTKRIGGGKKYQGQWKKPKRNGDQPTHEGLGTIWFKDGSMYQGQILNSEFNGKGRMTHANGDIFQGEWKDGKAQGQGVFVDKNGSMYEGQWENDQYHGKGVESWKFN